MLTKQEMERIWNEEPVGYLKTISKKRKFVVKYRYCKTIYTNYETKEVYLHKKVDGYSPYAVGIPSKRDDGYIVSIESVEPC